MGTLWMRLVLMRMPPFSGLSPTWRVRGGTYGVLLLPSTQHFVGPRVGVAFGEGVRLWDVPERGAGPLGAYLLVGGRLPKNGPLPCSTDSKH